MNISVVAIFLVSLCICTHLGQSKSLKSHYGNSIKRLERQGKMLGSPVAEEADYKRAKRDVPAAIHNLQQVLNNAKAECVREMNMSPQAIEKSLLYNQHPTREEKCLIKCMLQKTKLMEESNKLSARTIARIAGAFSDSNPLVVAIAEETANKCNTLIRARDPCEIAHQINKCIGGELKAHRLKLLY